MSFRLFASKAVLVAGAAGLLASGGAAAASAAPAAAPKATARTAIYNGEGEALEVRGNPVVGWALFQNVPRIPQDELFREQRDSHGALELVYYGSGKTEYLEVTSTGTTLLSAATSHGRQEATEFYAFPEAGTVFSDLAEVDSRGYHPSRYSGPELLRDEMLTASVTGDQVVVHEVNRGGNGLVQEWAQGTDSTRP